MKALTLTVVITATLLTGCGGSDGGPHQNSGTNNMELFKSESSQQMFVQPFKQIDVFKNYVASAGGESIKLTTMNGDLDEDSEIRLEDVSYSNKKLYACGLTIKSLQKAMSQGFFGMTPEEKDYRTNIESESWKYLGKEYFYIDNSDGSRAELESAKFQWVSLSDKVNIKGIVDFHKGIGFNYMNLNLTAHNQFDTLQCNIELQDWETTNNMIL